MNKKLIAISIVVALLFSTFIVFNQNNTTKAATNNPINLKIYISPTNIPADNNTYNCIFIQLQDQNGQPFRALQNTIVSLSSSAAGIGTVDQTATILKGQTYASANFTSTFLPGTTNITAASPNYSTVQDQITTVGPYPYKTAVYGFPSLLPANAGTYSAIMVQLQDSSGSPARAPNNVQVSLFSSNTAVGTVSSTITILKGQTYAIATFTSTINPGATQITAEGQGYVSTQTTITTQLPTTPAQLKIFEGPPRVPADHNSYKQIAVELQDASGNIAVANSDTIITVSSSDNTIATTDQQITIPAGSTYALATLYTTYSAGTTILTAATNGLQYSQQSITTVGYTPSQLAVFCVPSTLPADNTTYTAVQVQLQDSQGQPAPNPVSNLIIKLFSSNLNVGKVSSTITIPAGQTQATANFTTTTNPDVTTITAIGSNYTTGQATLTTYLIDYSVLQVAETANPQSINSGNTTTISAYVTANGAPIIGATVTFSSANGGTFSSPVDDGNGTYQVTFTPPNFSSTSNCLITANAAKDGYLSGQTTTQLTVEPAITPTTTPTPSPNETPTTSPTPTPNPKTTTNSTGTLTLCILDASNDPVSGTVVSSTSQPSGMGTLLQVTNATGYVTFKNVDAGSYTFKIVKEGYPQANASINFPGQSFKMNINLASSTASPINYVELIIIIVIVAGAGVGFGVFWLIRRGNKAKSRRILELQQQLKPKT